MSTVERAGTSDGGDVALLVDWENLKFSLRQRDRRPNVQALRDAAERFGRIVFARAYADWQDPVHSGDPAGLYLAGLEPVYVLTRRYSDESGEVRIKNSVDIRLAADCVEASHQFPNIGTYIIVTGDHGFIHVVNTLRPHGKRVVVIGVSWTTAAQLTEQADVVLYYDIDVERMTGDGEHPTPGLLTPQKVAPRTMQLADEAVARLKAEHPAQEADPRKAAEMLDLVMTVAKEYRSAKRDLTVSILGQELSKRMNDADFRRYGRGTARPLAQVLADRGDLKLVERDFAHWIFLPGEPDAVTTAAALPTQQELPRYDYAGFVWSDVAEADQERLIRAIHEERHRPGTDWLTFNRIQAIARNTLGRDDYASKNLVSNMVVVGVLNREQQRTGYAPDTGFAYQFTSFALDLEHQDVRRALKLG